MTDDVTRYLELFDHLRRRKRWTTDTQVLRLAALSLASSHLADPARELEAAADRLRERAGWFGSQVFKSSTRYAVAALILRRNLSPARVHDNVAAVRKIFRKQKLRRGGLSETLAALILVLRSEGRVVPEATVARMTDILRRWKADHFWLTGSDDYPMAALHANRDVPPDSVARTVEAIYEALRGHGFRRGNRLQLASHILSLGSGSGTVAARRFRDLVTALKGRKERAGVSRYDEIALLALLSASPAEIARTLVAIKERLRAARPRPAAEIAFSLSTGLLLSREVERAEGLPGSADLAVITAAQSVLDAQSAAMVAVLASSTAAAAAASG